jgi:hypothetical protein
MWAWWRAGASPTTASVDVHVKGYTNITVTHEKDGGGSVKIDALADMDWTKKTRLEEIDLDSRWNASGAGRAEVVMSGGDLTQTVKATECWSTTFARSYYEDTVGFQETEGDVKSCAF